MKYTFSISSSNEQGMQVVSVELFLSEKAEAGMMKVGTMEDGFDDIYIFTVYLTREQILWMPGHFWVKRFFNPTVNEMIMQVVDKHFDSLHF